MTKRGGKTNNPQRPLRVTAQQSSSQPAPAPGRYQPRLLREYRSKAEREAVLQRYLILGTIAIVAVLALVLAIAFVVDGVIRPRQNVASVNGTAISVAQFENRVRLERALINERVNQGFQLYQSVGYSQDQAIQQLEQQQPYATYISEIQVADQLGNRVLNDMIEEELIRQEAAARGLTVTDEQIEEQIEPLFGYDPEEGLFTATPSPEPTITPTPFVSPTPTSTPPPTATPSPEATQDATAPTATVTITPAASNTPAPTPDATQRATDYQTDRADYFGQLRALAGVGDADIRAYYEVQALREQLRDSVGAEIGATGPFVNARHILVGTETEAQDVLTALQSGESFAELARVVSTDTSSGANGGELDWNPATQYVPAFAEAVRTAEIGALVGPVQTDFGYHVIQVRAREDRELTEDQQDSAKDQALTRYLEDLRDADTTNVEIFDIWTSNVPDEPALRLR